MEIEKFDSVKYWLESMAGRAEGTKRSYLSHLMLFCEWLGNTPDELIAGREAQLKSEDKKVQRTMEMHVKRYSAYLDEQGAGAGTKTTARAAIKSFFEHHYMKLQFIRGDFPTEAMEERRKVERDEIVAMLELADVRDRTLIHVLKDTGLAVSDVSRLKIGDVFPKSKMSPITDKDVQSLPDFISLSMVRKKTKAKIMTFLGREAVQALKTYLEYRLRGTAHVYPGQDVGEKGITPEILTLNSPLFRIRSRKVEGMSTKRIKDTIRDIAKRSGISGISAHSFRKYTQTMLEVARIDPNWRKLILGKKLPGSEGSYSMPSNQDLQRAYEEAYQHIQVIGRLSLEELQKRQQIAEMVMDKLMRGEPFTDEDRANVKRYGIQIRERAGKAVIENTQTNGGSSDCAERFEQIKESELLAYLREGWQMVHRLQSGDVIIRKV